jgi:hypothetical protein
VEVAGLAVDELEGIFFTRVLALDLLAELAGRLLTFVSLGTA